MFQFRQFVRAFFEMLQNVCVAVQAGEDLFDPFSVLSALRFEPGFFCKQLFFLRNCFFQNLFLQLVNPGCSLSQIRLSCVKGILRFIDDAFQSLKQY